MSRKLPPGQHAAVMVADQAHHNPHGVSRGLVAESNATGQLGPRGDHWPAVHWQAAQSLTDRGYLEWASRHPVTLCAVYRITKRGTDYAARYR